MTEIHLSGWWLVAAVMALGSIGGVVGYVMRGRVVTTFATQRPRARVYVDELTAVTVYPRSPRSRGRRKRPAAPAPTPRRDVHVCPRIAHLPTAKLRTCGPWGAR